MRRRLPLVFIPMLFALPVSARTMYVATTGNDTASGFIDAPYATVHKAVAEAAPGDTIYVRGGTYYLTSRIKIDKAGRDDAYICLFGYPGENPVLDGSKITYSTQNEFKMARCIYVNHFGDYWHFKNLELCNAHDNGMKLEGSYNIVENCRFHDNNDTGLQIGMYKDFSIEETNEFPVSGSPQFNPDYTYCRYNTVINCDAWNNYDSRSYNGSDDGGDADGFACKLFPGPGTEFHGCRAWNNSDDNWDLYMVYHPVVIDNCWNWNGGRDKEGVSRGNGNGFKLGGGGTSGGAAFSQSVGAHVVKNCVSFNNVAKGYDQNNAYEAMYLFNNVAWGNEYNYRFPTVIEYGTMYMRNNIGFKPGKLNHEFLSEGKPGYKMPDTEYNSWTTFDGCDPIKDGNKVNGTKVNVKDYTAQFVSLAEALAKAPRQEDGSLPENDFGRLIAQSVFIDAGQIVTNFLPEAHSPGGITAQAITIPYNDNSADMGAFESGIATYATLTLASGKLNQVIYTGEQIEQIRLKWGNAATGVTVSGETAGLTIARDEAAKTIAFTGAPTADAAFTVATVGGENQITLDVRVKISTEARAILTLLSGTTVQEVIYGEAMTPIVAQWGGGATNVAYDVLPAGVTAAKDVATRTLTISGTPTADGTFRIYTLGGMEGSEKSFNCNITQVYRMKVLTGDWYGMSDAWDALPADLRGVISLVNGSDETKPTVWDPAYVESSGSAPSGCTTGAVNIERSGGAVVWTLPSLVEMKLNLHFTGTRTLKIDYTIGDGATKTWTSASLSKRTMLNWNLMDELGLEPTRKPVTIKLYHTATNGGMRLYDFYTKVYDQDVESGIAPLFTHELLKYYQTGDMLVVYADVANIDVMGLNGRRMAGSQHSRTVSTGALPAGIYVARITLTDGTIRVIKFRR